MTAANIGVGGGVAMNGGQLGDTTFTKVFVGGLAWETQKETMKTYFEQFGHILEAVVISDKSTGRSKGYGFVTFREPEAATRACVDAAPVIDGRRANCNLASMGAQKSKPSTPKHGGGRKYRIMGSFPTGGFQGVGAPFHSPATHYAFPYNHHVFGYSPYSSDYTSYPTSYYNVYGGAATHHQFPLYGAMTGHGGVMSGGASATPYYPSYLHQYGGEASAAMTGGGGSYSGAGSYSAAANVGGHVYGGVQYPHHQVFQYANGGSTYLNQHYGTPISVSPSPALQSGVTMGLHHAPPPIPHHL